MDRTFVLGLDGCTFDVLDPMMTEGEMPNLAALCESGARGILQSTMPPVTGPAWYSLATGKSPGVTGIYDFLRRVPDADGFEMEHLSSDVYRDRAIWDYLGAAGLDVGVIDYPTLSPPYPVEGFMISGGLGSGGHECYPDSLGSDLAGFDKPEAHLDISAERYSDVSVFVDDAVENLQRRADIVEHVLTDRTWDFCWAVLQEPDWAQHLLWKYFDEDHFEADETNAAESNEFRRFWRELDAVIGRLVDACPDGTSVAVQSDHGFGPLNDISFRLNTWLANRGYMTPKRNSGAHWWVKKRLRNTLSFVSRRLRVDEWAPQLFEWGRNQTLSFAIQLNAIDTSESKLFDPGHIGAMGGLYANDGALTADERAVFLEEVHAELRTFADKYDLPLELYFPEEYYGEKAPGSPDLIVRLAGGVIEDGGWNEPVIDTRPNRLSHQSGSHRQAGVLILDGPGFTTGTFEDTFVYDLAPTLLHAFGQPVPESMNGEVRTDLLATDRAVKRRAVPELEELTQTNGDRAELQKQLRDLGYFQ